jgi:urea transporter
MPRHRANATPPEPGPTGPTELESCTITAGLLSFNPVLTAIALGAVFYLPGPRVVAYTLLATVLSVIVQGAVVAALTPFGIPTFTAAFVLVSWLFLLPRQQFE